MTMPNANKFNVHQRLTALESEITSLHTEIKAQSAFQQGQLQNYLSDKSRELLDLTKTIRSGEPGKDGASIVGPQGERGPAGDITVVGSVELQDAVDVLRA